MQIHASCAARAGAGVLVVGPPGAGKSDLVLRLLDRGFTLVADDRVMIEHGMASAPPGLAGLLEVRGLGIVRVAHLTAARLALLVRLVPQTEIARLPMPHWDAGFDLPTFDIDPWQVSAAGRVAVALDCALGKVSQHVGAFAP